LKGGNLLTPTLKKRLCTINSRIDRIGKFISSEKNLAKDSKKSSSRSPSKFAKSKPDIRLLESSSKKNLKSRHVKSSSDLIRSSIEKLQTYVDLRRSKGKTHSLSKEKKPKSGSKSTKRETTMPTFALKNITIKNIVVNAHPKYKSRSIREPQSSTKQTSTRSGISAFNFLRQLPMRGHLRAASASGVGMQGDDTSVDLHARDL
jgi:hypothetical protein